MHYKQDRIVSDHDADKYIFIALAAWAMSCVQPAIGMLVQFPLIAILVAKCDIKFLPALMLLQLGRGNVRALQETTVALRLGITLTPGAFFAIAVFLHFVLNLVKQRYDASTSAMGWLCLLALIPGAIMSFIAKGYGLVGIWSGPVMYALVPAVYFWGVSMARTYMRGRLYFASRLAFVMLATLILMSLRVCYVFNFYVMSMGGCLFIFAYSDSSMRRYRGVCLLCLLVSLFLMLFGRKMAFQELSNNLTENVNELDTKQMGSTFSRMAIYAISIFLSLNIGKTIGKSLTRAIPIMMTVVSIGLVSFVISTQSGNNAKDVVQDYGNMEERFTYKLFGDRATVWTMGWEEVKEPPYIIKDLRKFLVMDNRKGLIMKLLPHNQFLTLLGRNGLWLGLTLAILIVWVQVRAFRCYTLMPDDKFFSRVFLPVGSALFFVTCIAGQSAATSDLWEGALVTLVMPGIIYGCWAERKKTGGFPYQGNHIW